MLGTRSIGAVCEVAHGTLSTGASVVHSWVRVRFDSCAFRHDRLMTIEGVEFYRDLLGRGWTEHELAALRRRGELDRLRRGAYASTPATHGVARHALVTAATMRELASDAVVSGPSAAVLHRLPLWRVSLERVHVSRPRRSGGRKGRLVHVHPAPLDEDEIVMVGGLRVTSVARTVVDVARWLPFEQAVVVADHALHHHQVGRRLLVGALARAAHRPGNAAARRVIDFADAGSESVGESRSRVAIARARLPPPRTQWPVHDAKGTVIAYTDFGWPDHGSVGEFDGLAKYQELLRPGESAADAVVREKLREDRVRDQHLRVGRWIWSDLDDFRPVAGRLARMLGL